MKKLNYDKPIEIAPKVYWVGYNVKDAWFCTNSYLMLEGNEAVLIDPGSIVDYAKVYAKVQRICPIKKIKHIILHHQDPDLCGSTIEFEKLTDFTIHMPKRATIFTKFYGIKSFVNTVDKDNQDLEFKTRRKLKFFLTPYCHAPGAMVTYDERNKILFSSDIFGAFNKNWELYADMIGHKNHLKSIKMFMEPYMASRQAIMNFVKKVEKLDIKMICPQHGSIIRNDVKKWISELKKMKYGTAITEKRSGLEFDILSKEKR